MVPKRLLAVVLLLSACAANAEDHDEAKRLRESETIVSLEALIRSALQHIPGRVIKVELEESDDQYLYEIEVLDQNNKVRELWYDAKTGQLIRERADD